MIVPYHSNINIALSQPYEGLKLQDLRRLKDMLIVETADMLQAPLFTAEALLRAHGGCKPGQRICYSHHYFNCCNKVS